MRFLRAVILTIGVMGLMTACGGSKKAADEPAPVEDTADTGDTGDTGDVEPAGDTEPAGDEGGGDEADPCGGEEDPCGGV